MTTRHKNTRTSAIPSPFRVLVVSVFGALAASGQVCTLSPNTTGGPQYNQPQPEVVTIYGTNVAVAWPQSYEVLYVEFAGFYNGYYTYFPSDYTTSIATAYSNWASSSSQNESGLSYIYYGTNDSGLNDAGSQGNPDFQPWHQWIVVNQSDLSSPSTLGETSSAWQNYGSNAEPYWAIGTAESRVTNAMSYSGYSQSFEAHVFAHEIGHTMALLDCVLCQQGAGGTIMSYSSSLLEYSSLNITGPQYCDNQQVQQTAYPY